MRLIDENVINDLHAYIAVICKELNSFAYRVGGTADHIHIACNLPRTLPVSKLLEEVKRSSSAWIKTQGSKYGDFSWQGGYGAFSVGQSQLSGLMRYINAQKEHHKSQSFKEELLAILKKYGVEYDEKYLWD